MHEMIERLPTQFEGATNHDARALADEVGEVGISDWFEVSSCDRMVEAGNEIRCGVDKSAIEVKDHQGSRHECLLADFLGERA